LLLIDARLLAEEAKITASFSHPKFLFLSLNFVFLATGVDEHFLRASSIHLDVNNVSFKAGEREKEKKNDIDDFFPSFCGCDELQSREKRFFL
jgi:hypothetical protein